MTKEEMTALLWKGAAEWNAWRAENPDADLNFRALDLHGINLEGAELNRADFAQADLTDARFNGAQLHAASFRRGCLLRAQFKNAHLTGAYIGRVYAREADFSNANLYQAHFHGSGTIKTNFTGAILSEAKFDENSTVHESIFTGALLVGTKFVPCDFGTANLAQAIFHGAFIIDSDLSKCIGLVDAVHQGPSTISLGTIYRSNGRIADAFLLGTGIPESFIPFIPSLVGAQEGIQFHSCFISYSHKDEDFARRLHARMRAANLRVWYAPEDMQGGRKLNEQIETAIHLQDKLLLVLSEASMGSEWVAHEIYTARQREKRENRQILFPIALCPFEQIRQWKSFDADTGKDMAREVREYLIPDFSGWKDHDTFEEKFTRLLRDLKAEDEVAAG